MPQPPERSIKISVVVICFNQEHTIGAALGSVLAQSAWSRIGEVIVVDDCSTDGSVAVIRQIAARHPRIHVIARTTNSGGCAVPRNDGIRQTTGTHVALLDGDDIWNPDKIATQIAALEAFPHVGLLFSDYFGFDHKTGRQQRGVVNRYAADDTDQLRRFFIHGGPILPSCAVLSRGAIDAAGLFDATMPFNEDAEYWLRVAAVAPLHHQGLPLVRKREWYGSLGSAKYALENLACKREITQRMLRRVPDLAPAADAREARIAYKTAVHFLTSGDRARARRHLRLCLTLDPRFAKAGAALLLSYLPSDPAVALRAARTIWSRRRPGLR
jgi:glycosyltransferase involved in cell wall biosynthesis